MNISTQRARSFAVLFIISFYLLYVLLLCTPHEPLEISSRTKAAHLRSCSKPSNVVDVSQAIAPHGWTALVTGVAGFIGSHVAKDCLALGLEVVGVDDLSGGFRSNIPSGVRFVLGDVKNASFVSQLFEAENFDLVYHLAAYAAEGLSHFIRNYNYQNNLIATTNLVTQSVRVNSVKMFVFTSSIAVYGAGRTPMTEDMEPLPEDPYGISKLACEFDLKAAHDMFGLEYVIFRPHNVYGPGQNMYDKYRNVVGIFLNQLQSGQDMTIFGDGTQTRKFSYVSDVSYPIALSGLLPHVRGQVFNVGGDIATTVNELAAVTKDTWGNPTAVIQHLDSRNEVPHAESDHKKLNCFFPGLPKPVGLREGMLRMVEWAKTEGKQFKPVEFDAVEVKRNLPNSWITKGMKETPAFQHDIHDNKIEIEYGFTQIPALVVFSMIRDDLLDLHLASIDYKTRHVFVVVNYANDDRKQAIVNVVDQYTGCTLDTTSGENCKNLHIKEIHLLASSENIGYAGSFNAGMKAVVEHNLQYAIFSGDDTRFRPGRLLQAKKIMLNSDACMYHFEGYSCFGITQDALRSLGPMDENFWPIYSEDCDYWFRTQLAECKVYYRGGYKPETQDTLSLQNAFVEHGDATIVKAQSSSTFKSDPFLSKLVENTLDSNRGRFAYLVHKWGFDTCGLYHKVLNTLRSKDEVLDALSEVELTAHSAHFILPYDNSNFSDVKYWSRDDWRKPGAISSRAVNARWAPQSFVWQEQDFSFLDPRKDSVM